ncbi:hypothetical protein BKA64DRAFT_451570 [Cadophora sp. MPI-SDFR-AT-0126]|nr:hypothetical protein BKA64DRAFT_451570 [Leotiomycetes sp. MPI-SDFR-AT-0126]
MEKDEYFRQLYTLNDSSDDENDTNEAREVWRQSKLALVVSSSTSLASRCSQRRSQLATSFNKVPGIHRTTSAPVTSDRIVKETPPALLRRKSSLLRHDISSQDISTPPSGSLPPCDTSTSNPAPERSAFTPNIGSVVMNNSKGIAAMLGKRQGESLAKAATKKKVAKVPARKDVVKLVREADRVFNGKTIYWIPDDDIDGIRKARINKAREYGAIWSKNWTADITHVVVDKKYTYQQVMEWFARKTKFDELPRGVVLVTEQYIIDCASFKRILEPEQRQYIVKGRLGAAESHTPSPSSSQASVQSLQLTKNAKTRKGKEAPEDTPSQSQPSTQGVDKGPVDASSRISLLQHYHRETELPATPRPDTPTDPDMSKTGDVLDEYIDLIRKAKDLPLDDDDDFRDDDEDSDRLSSRDGTEDSCGSDDEREWRKKQKNKSKFRKYAENELGSFACMYGGTGKIHKDNPNRHTIDILEQMGEHYKRVGDQWRTRAYQQAVGILKQLKVKVDCYEDAIRLPRIGTRIARKIEEICTTGHLRRLDNALADPTDKIITRFLKIYGVGLSQAHKWIQAGYKSLDDLLALPNLHKNQRIGIEHYDDFNTRIPREEVTALGDIVKKIAAEIDPNVEAIIGGSYRRGADSSGDIDFIITKRHTRSSWDLLHVLETLVARLTRDGFLVAALAVPASTGSKWHGACVLPGNPFWRRIDFLVVPETEFGAALLYFTGDDIFNRSIRLLASKKNMRLNQKGLYKDVLRTFGREKLSQGTLVEGGDERKIFDLLGVPWRPPHERICH